MNAPVKSATVNENPVAVRGMRKWLLRNALEEYGDLLASYGRTIAEAAFQGNDSLIRASLRSNQITLKAAIEAYRELAALSAEDTPSDEGQK